MRKNSKENFVALSIVENSISNRVNFLMIGQILSLQKSAYSIQKCNIWQKNLFLYKKYFRYKLNNITVVEIK